MFLVLGRQFGPCDLCRKAEFSPFKRQHCERTFCSDHRLPGSHKCPENRDRMNLPPPHL
ncbi:MAG: AN1-type zinc finger domain-containing protein [Nitrososphaerota archaeon]|nr:AN1-type zinc finger domain-containing protein [Nitrososphaerota archaeon]